MGGWGLRLRTLKFFLHQNTCKFTAVSWWGYSSSFTNPGWLFLVQWDDGVDLCFVSAFITAGLAVLGLNICLNKPNKNCKEYFYILNSVLGFYFFRQYFWVWRFKSIKSRPVSVNIYLSQSCVWAWCRADQRCEGSCYHSEQKKKWLEQTAVEQSLPSELVTEACPRVSTDSRVCLEIRFFYLFQTLSPVSPSLNPYCYSQSCPLLL